ncbi:MAG: LTA synthase family protein [Nitrospiraceae bacterium]|nr:MAG: LTA synthase family protein [Nitrospiraceae bacterium]
MDLLTTLKSKREEYYQLNLIIFILKLMSAVLAGFVVCRVLFLLMNMNLFDWIAPKEYVSILFYGLRFDLVSIAYINLALVILIMLPLPLLHSTMTRKLLFFLFLLTNGTAVFVNITDIIYYRFTLKRSTSDFLDMLVMGGDVATLVPQFIHDYWYVGLISVLILLPLAVIFLRMKPPRFPGHTSFSFYVHQCVWLLLVIALSVVAIRGGVQSKPISILTASRVSGARNVPLVINTPFSIIRTIGKNYLVELDYFSFQELSTIFSPIHDYSNRNAPFKHMNVVIIIMESFGKEYMGPPYGNEGFTPFLDSLADRGLFYDRAFANEKTSMNGIPAILAGIPTLTQDPFIRSVYAGNEIEGLASILGSKGYQTAFFHGGRTGTMRFDTFSKIAGFQRYYGKEDYPDVYDFDGHWGISDEPFFQYFVQEIGKMKHPFFASILSLSSHHPYQLPEKYINDFPEGKHPIVKTIKYADHALEQFFNTAKKMDWFQHTLFVITADHTAVAFHPFYRSRVGNYSIPIILYSPSDPELSGTDRRTAQQLDIMPTVLDYLNYDKPFFSVGMSMLSNAHSFYSISMRENTYQLIHDRYALHYNTFESIAFYDYEHDIKLEKNLIDYQNPEGLRDTERLGRAVLQTYHHALINNLMTASRWEKNDNRQTSVAERY